MRKGRPDRYNLEEARDLGNRAQPPRTKNIDPVTVAIPDPKALPPPFDPDKPYKGPQRFIGTVNRRVDILEYERSHGRISNEAYLEGRIVQAMFERQGLPGGSTWTNGSRIDAELAKEMAILRRVDAAAAITAQLKKLRDLLGDIDTGILRQVLGENRVYAEVAQTRFLNAAAADGGVAEWEPLGAGGMVKRDGKTVRRERIAYVAQRFRDALETLARETRRR